MTEPTILDDLGRDVTIFLCKDGTLSYAKRGDKATDKLRDAPERREGSDRGDAA